MAKVAKLITISLMTRVVVDENATDEQIIEVAKPKLIEKIRSEAMENLEEIVDDAECPCGTFYTDTVEKFYQPQINDEGTIVGHEDEEIFSFEVWASKEKLLEQFPNCIVIEYTFEDIEDPAFVDL
jgi:hypothetical protein